MIPEFQFVTYQELYEAYLECRQHKRKTYNSLEFEIDENVFLYKLWIDLNTQQYEIGLSITFCVSDPCKREVFAAHFRDRIVHHLVVKKFRHFFEQEFIQDSYSCRIGKGTLYGVLRCDSQIKQISNNYSEDCIIIKGDIQSFFMMIDKNILSTQIDQFIDRTSYSLGCKTFYKWLYKKIIYHCPQHNFIRKQPRSAWNGLPPTKSLFYCDDSHGIPIGNLTSQILANFYLSGFDRFVQQLTDVHGYGRYVDDFYIIVKDKSVIQNIIQQIKNYLASLNLKLHPRKLYIQHFSKGIKFIGAVIKPNRIYISNRTKGRLFWKLHNFEKEARNDNELLQYYCSCINSYLGFMIYYKSYNVRKKLLKNPWLSKYFYAPKHDLKKICLYKNYCPEGYGKKNRYVISGLYY